MNVIAICNDLYKDSDITKKDNFFYIWKKEDLSYDLLKSLQPDYIFFPHWSYKIDAEIYENFNCVIFHETDLPFGRGGSPIQNLIERGIYHTKITALKCSKTFDSGDIYLKKDISLEDKSAREIFIESGNIVSTMIDEIVYKNIKPYPQEGEVVVFKRRTPEMSNIGQLSDLVKIYDYIRMLDADGYPNAYLDNNNIRYKFTNVKKKDNKLVASVEIEVINNE